MNYEQSNAMEGEENYVVNIVSERSKASRRRVSKRKTSKIKRSEIQGRIDNRHPHRAKIILAGNAIGARIPHRRRPKQSW
jgi:hypothetical protein